jgi:hypothetical protein
MATIELRYLLAARDALKRVFDEMQAGTVDLPLATRGSVAHGLGVLNGSLSLVEAMRVEIRNPNVEEPAA